MKYKRLFDPGEVVFSDRVEKLRWEDNRFKNFVNISLGKHLSGNWGVIDDEDKRVNDEAVNTGDRLMSAYIFHKDMPDEKKILIITKADRSKTTILFLKEY